MIYLKSRSQEGIRPPPQLSGGRRRLLTGSSALAASGWVAGVAGGWLLRPSFSHAAGPIKMGIATDITGAIAPSGNANWQVAQYAIEQINSKSGGMLATVAEQICA